MTTIAAPAFAAPTERTEGGLRGWLGTTDHKRIGYLYFFTSLCFMLWGGAEAMIIRLQLMGPNRHIVSPNFYNQLFTMHGTTMIFLVIMPLSAAFFNLLIPLQIGARDVAFPRLNAFSYWVYLLGGLVITIPILFSLGPDGGWFGYAPLTTNTYSPGLNIDFWAIGLQILGISSLAAGVQLHHDDHQHARARHEPHAHADVHLDGVRRACSCSCWRSRSSRSRWCSWCSIASSARTSTTIQAGADPLLWQHLFWIFGHPEVYILILPAFGLVSEVLPTFSRKPLFGYPVMVYSGILIGFLGFGVWAHHMFAVGMGPIADTVFSVTTMLIAIPTGVKIFNWIFTMWGGSIRFTTAMHVRDRPRRHVHRSAASPGSCTPRRRPISSRPTRTSSSRTSTTSCSAGPSWACSRASTTTSPRLTGRLLDERLGKLAFLAQPDRVQPRVLPDALLGHARDAAPYRTPTMPTRDGTRSTCCRRIGAFTMGVATLILVFNILMSRKRGALAGNDPWGGGTLEWSIPSPPPIYNFAKIPRVTSRYPMWDLKSPQLAADVPHTRAGDKAVEVDLASARVAGASPAGTGGATAATGGTCARRDAHPDGRRAGDPDSVHDHQTILRGAWASPSCSAV